TTWQWLRGGTEIPGATAATFTLSGGDEGAAISVRQTDTNGQGSDSATSASSTVTAASGSVARVTGLVVSDQIATGEVELAYSIDRDSSVTGVLTRSATAPSATRIRAGQDDTGAEAPSSFSDTWTSSGAETLPDIAPSLASDIYYLHLVPAGGNDTDVASSNGFRLETVAPTITAAQTTTSGLEIEVDFSEALSGSTDASDWALSADGAAQQIVTVSFNDTRLTLSLSTQLSAGQTLSLDYAGSDLTDMVANPVAAVSGVSVTNAVSGSFIENSVSVPDGSALTATDPLPSDARALLLFASLTQDAALDARAALATWNGTAGGFHTDYTAGNGLSGVRLRLLGGSTSITQGTETVPLGTRYHLLVSAWLDTDDIMNVRAWSFDTAAGSWSEVVNVSDPTAPGSSFNLGSDPLRLFMRSDRTNQTFAGTVNRVAFWATPQSQTIADISDPAIRDTFADADGLREPALSRISFGQPLVDFAGTAEDYNAGVHSGTFGSFQSSGTFL
ncbi:Ig-like domain-containing protein, partial [uncultured Roseobacter sp.]|uniref:Ig-like domain-containing protein n=1 Tax=uncultured Roseobacter sp. TaxID=114847 RepID=UPI002609F2A9